MRAWLAIGIFVCGCTNAAATRWVPTLALRGRWVAREGASRMVSRSRSDWQVAAELRWSPWRPVARLPELVIPPAHIDAAGRSCIDAALCAWERRARTRALSAWEASR